MLAQRRYEEIRPTVTRPRARRRKRTSIVKALVRNRMAGILAVAVVASVMLNVYASAYAKFTRVGYQRSDMMATLRTIEKDNEVLRLRLDQLRQPETIEAYAITSGMMPSQEMVYLKSTEIQPHLAQNTAPGDIR